MNKILALFICLFSLLCRLSAQTFPAEGSKLNYRLVGFSFPKANPGDIYTIQIAEGTYNNRDSFKRNILTSFTTDTNKVIHLVPAFGKEYTWRVATVLTPYETAGPLQHFSTIKVPDVDSNITRLRILKHAETYKDAYVFLDASRTLYDMEGNPVWYVPISDGVIAENFPSYGDVKITPQKSITFMTNRKSGHIYDIDYNGKILWKGPNTGEVSGDSIENYNHEFTRLPNGHYMVLGGEYVPVKLPGKLDSIVLKNPLAKGRITYDAATKKFYELVHFGTLIEYDSTGKVVWSWKSSKYFTGSDVYKRTTMLGYYEIYDVHENSFFFDRAHNVIYISFKNVSRILKIDYPTGKVLNVYGKLNDQGAPGYDNSLFHDQHSVRLTHDGYLSVYNNNDRHYGSLPTLLLMQETGKGDTLKKVWEYECTTDGLDITSKVRPKFAGLGSVEELPDYSMFACMTDDDYTRVFIVNRDKQTLWSAMPERWVPNYHKWVAILEYKPSIITDPKDVEELIWNAEANTTGH